MDIIRAPGRGINDAPSIYDAAYAVRAVQYAQWADNVFSQIRAPSNIGFIELNIANGAAATLISAPAGKYILLYSMNGYTFASGVFRLRYNGSNLMIFNSSGTSVQSFIPPHPLGILFSPAGGTLDILNTSGLAMDLRLNFVYALTQ